MKSTQGETLHCLKEGKVKQLLYSNTNIKNPEFIIVLFFQSASTNSYCFMRFYRINPFV